MVTLENSRLFSQLAPAELDKLRALAREKTYTSGQEIFREGEEGDGLYLVKDGSVEISALVAPNSRHVFSHIQAGDVFGEMAVLEDKPRSATAVAMGTATVYFLPRAEFLELMDASPAMARSALREISRRLREFDHQYLVEVFQAEGLAAIGRFAAWVVHDLKNPVHLIGLAAETACLPNNTLEDRRHAKEIIRQQVNTIRDLVDEILAVSQGPPPDLLVTASSYGEFLGQMVAEARAMTAPTAAHLAWPEDPPPALVQFNPQRLRRVFLNLLQHATSVTPEGGTIFVRVRAEPNQVVTEIEDGGSGIPPEVAGRLFSAFASYGKVQGTGLGLFICKRILEEHKGWITAGNSPRGGSVFTFGLPLANRRG